MRSWRMAQERLGMVSGRFNCGVVGRSDIQ